MTTVSLGGGVLSEETDFRKDLPSMLEGYFERIPEGSVGVVILITPTGLIGGAHLEVVAYTTSEEFEKAMASQLSPGQIRYHQEGDNPSWPDGFALTYVDETRKE